MTRLRWLGSGIGVKRWVFVIFGGFLLGGLGIGSQLGLHDPGPSQWFRHTVAQLSSSSALLIVVAGMAIVSVGVIKLSHNLVRGLEHHDDASGYASAYLMGRLLKKGPRIVALGGGTGLATILEGLKEHSSNITAIVTVSDDGGSSGRLRKDLSILPPGDVRNCLVALARRGPLLSRLLQYRFTRGEGLIGHSFGNLLIAALTDMTGSFIDAIQSASQVLAIAGEVMPSTCQNVTLGAVFDHGKTILGETSIAKEQGTIVKIFLTPRPVFPPQETLERLARADLVVLGPGSLFTSIIPNLLVEGLADAINRTPAQVVYIANIMTQPGETDGLSLSGHLRALFDLTPLRRIDMVIKNRRPIGSMRLLNYERQGSIPVTLNESFSTEFSIPVLESDILSMDGLVRHDPRKTATLLMSLLSRKPLASLIHRLEN